MSVFTKLNTLETHRLKKRTYGCQGSKDGEGIGMALGMDMYTPLYVKWMSNKDLV